MYTSKNFKSKKSLKEAVANGERVAVYQPGPFSSSVNTKEGKFCVEGPWYPEPHKWYAEVLVKDYAIVKVK